MFFLGRIKIIRYRTKLFLIYIHSYILEHSLQFILPYIILNNIHQSSWTDPCDHLVSIYYQIHPSVPKKLKHWFRTFESYLSVLPQENLNKLNILINFIASEIFEYVSDSTTYDSAIEVLHQVYIKSPNTIFLRHLLATRRQTSNELFDDYMQALKILAKDCDFKQVTAQQHCNEAIRDTFINGIISNDIRQRLLEHTDLTLDDMYNKARAYESAQKHSENYITPYSPFYVNTASTNIDPSNNQNTESTVSAVSSELCYFCGNKRHPRIKCPAKEVFCNRCNKKGHFAKVCRSARSESTSTSDSTNFTPTLASIAAPSGNGLEKSKCPVVIQNNRVQALIDSGSTDSFISQLLVEQLSLDVKKSEVQVHMASTSLCSQILGVCFVDILINERTYKNVVLKVMKDLCADVLLGLDFQSQHQSVVLNFGGTKEPLTVSLLSMFKTEPPQLFNNLSPNLKPIAAKSRQFSENDKEFIHREIQRMTEEGIIQPSTSPWRAQVVVTSGERWL